MHAKSMVANSWCAAFSRQADGRIVAWNRQAESLFDVPARAAVGRPCFEVIGGRDTYGNDYCCPGCATWHTATRNHPVHPYRLTVTVNASRILHLRVLVFPIHRAEGPELVHLLEPLTSTSLDPGTQDGLDPDDAALRRRTAALTRREMQVLLCLAAGCATDDVASHLLISRATVRNHVASCLKKLRVHSRVEAVGVAHRLNLV